MDRYAMQRAVLGVDERFFAPPAAPAKCEPWTANEERLLREHYPQGGLKAALAVLPGRQRRAIYTRANILGLRAPGDGHLPTKTPTRYPHSEAVDAEIRRVYQAKPTRGDINALARRVMRPAGWVQKRATTLGVAVPRFRPADWGAAELALVENNAHKSYDTIRQILADRGFKRTATAIAVQVNRKGFDRTDPDSWTTGQLGRLMGVSSVTVLRWIDHEGLVATRKSDQDRATYVIHRDDLRRWIATHAQCVDLRKVERYWFIDLLTSAPVKPQIGRPRKKARE